MKEKLTQAAHRLQGQPMFQVLERVKELERRGKDIVHFEIGDPDFDTPPAIIDAGIASLRGGNTHYVSSYGLDQLRLSIAGSISKELNFLPSKEQVLIAPGANSLIYFAIQCLVNPLEEVIVPSPAFSTYHSVLNFLNLKTVDVPLKEEQGFRLDPADIRARITPKTKLIILNSPHNPTGAVMTAQELQAIYAMAEEHDLYILSDEIYRLMSYDGKVSSICAQDKCLKRTIMINGFSKTFAMTGWRLGYMIAPQFIIEKVALLLQMIVSCVPPFIQEAGIAVFDLDKEEINEKLKELKHRRDVLVEGLNQLPGVSCVAPQGAFYAFANISATGMDSEEFAKRMLDEGGVALCPGPYFGTQGQGYVRLCFATPVERIKEGLSRMHAVLAQYPVKV